MREIKFRAWTTFCWINKGMIQDYQDTIYVEVFGFNSEELPVMQFIGLQDKKGKDVYESDIVKGKTFDGIPILGTVKFGSGSFFVDGETTSFYRWYDYDFEVIGNIFENPELL